MNATRLAGRLFSRWLLGFGLVLLASAAFAQTAPVFISPVNDAILTSPVLVFQWQVDASTVFYIMRIQEIDDDGNVLPGTATCEFSFTQNDTIPIGGSNRQLTYDLNNPPAFVNAQERQDLATMGSGRFRVSIIALQPLTEGEGSTTYTFGKPLPEIEMSTVDAKDPRDLRFRLFANDPDNTPDFRYTFTFSPQGEGGTQQQFVMTSTSEAINQSNLPVANNWAAMGLEQGRTYDLHLLVEDTIDQPNAEGQGASGTDIDVVRINDLAVVTSLPSNFVFHYDNSYTDPTIDVGVPNLTVSDLDSALLDVEMKINFVQGDPDPADQLFPDIPRNAVQTLTLQDLPTKNPGTPHPRYAVQVRARDDLDVFGEFFGPFEITLNQRPLVVSASGPARFDYPLGGSTHVDVPLSLQLDDFESPTLDVEVEIFDLIANGFLPAQILQDVPRDSLQMRTISLPKAPPNDANPQFTIRVRAIDTTALNGGDVHSQSEWSLPFNIMLNEIPRVTAAAAPPVVNYQGDPALVDIPITLTAQDKESATLQVFATAVATSGETYPDVYLGDVQRGVSTMLPFGLPPLHAPHTYNITVRVEDGHMVSSEPSAVLPVRLNRPPVAELVTPYLGQVFLFTPPMTDIPYTILLHDDWSDDLVVHFAADGIDDVNQHSDPAFTSGVPQEKSGQITTTSSGDKSMTFTVTDEDGNATQGVVDFRLHQKPVVEEILTPENQAFPFNGEITMITLDLRVSDDFSDPIQVLFDIDNNGEFDLDNTTNLPNDVNASAVLTYPFNAWGFYTIRVVAVDEYGVHSDPVLRTIRLNAWPTVILHTPEAGSAPILEQNLAPIPFRLQVLEDFDADVRIAVDIQTNGTSTTQIIDNVAVDGIQTVPVSFAQWGPTTIQTYAIDDNGYMSRTPDVRDILVNDRPQVMITQPTGEPQIRIDVPQNGTKAVANINFDATFSDTFGGALTHIWYFGDLTPDFYQAPPIMHAFENFRDYVVEYQVVDSRDAKGTDTLLVAINDEPSLSLKVFPAIFVPDTNTWRIERNRPTTFSSHGENIYRDQDEQLVLERDLNSSDDPGMKLLDTKSAPLPGYTQFIDGVETLTFADLGDFTYALTITERFDGQPVTTTGSWTIRVEEKIPELNQAEDWELYE